MKNDNSSSGDVISEVSAYISRSGVAELPVEVVKKAKHHILDTLAAIVCGSKLKPGHLAKKYTREQAGAREAQVIGARTVTSAINAAFANGIMAHADETDDYHPRSLVHPGTAVVPAALAVSEREGADGMRFLKSVVAGYDVGCRITRALGVDNLRQAYRSTTSIGGVFGAAAAAAGVLRLDDYMVRQVLSYTAQQASGVNYWVRDVEHVEKAFVFGGMPARNGVTAAILVQSGFTGVPDPLSGERNFCAAFSPDPKLDLLAEGLGIRYEIMFTNIKKYPVGGAIQAAAEAVLLLMNKHGVTSRDVEDIVVRLGEPGASTMNNRDMPSINVQYIVAVTLLDGRLTFEAAHSFERMKEPAVLEIKRRLKLVEDPELTAANILRQAIVEITTKGGARFREHVVSARGTTENRMTTEEVETKCRKLLAPVLGKDRSQKLIDTIWHLEQLKNVRELRDLISA